MSRIRILTLLLTLAFAFASAPAAIAQEEASFDPSSIPEVNQDEALIVLHQLREKLLAAGAAEEELDAAVDWFNGEAANLSEADVDELLISRVLADSDAEADDDEFGHSEEDEPELGDGEAGGEDDEDEDDE